MAMKKMLRRRWRVAHTYKHAGVFKVEIHYGHSWQQVAGGYVSVRAARADALHWLGPEFERID